MWNRVFAPGMSEAVEARTVPRTAAPMAATSPRYSNQPYELAPLQTTGESRHGATAELGEPVSPHSSWSGWNWVIELLALTRSDAAF